MVLCCLAFTAQWQHTALGPQAGHLYLRTPKVLKQSGLGKEISPDHQSRPMPTVCKMPSILPAELVAR